MIALGYALTLTGGPSVTSGIVSGTNRDVELKNGTVYRGLIQTDAAINKRNSGGPLVDVSGRVVDITRSRQGPDLPRMSGSRFR